MPQRTTGDRPELKPVNVSAAAIDIGSKMHMAAVNPDCTDIPVRAFGTFTQDLHDLADWFSACGVTSVAMESTGVYWIPAYEILEQRGFEVILVNARYAKNVPGRKTDVSDAAWYASFIPMDCYEAASDPMPLKPVHSFGGRSICDGHDVQCIGMAQLHARVGLWSPMIMPGTLTAGALGTNKRAVDPEGLPKR
jgi:transposase